MKKNKLFSFILYLIIFTNIIIYAEEDTISVNGCKLVGTLEVPKSDNPLEVAIIIPGSGPLNRDGNIRLDSVHYVHGDYRSYYLISKLLLENNYASLRFDKRGIGESGRVNESELTIDMYVNDVIEWIKFLKKDKRFSKIIIIGHSEGALLGILAAQQIKVDKYVSLCGAGKPFDIILKKQLKNTQLNQQISEENYNNCCSIIDSLKKGVIVKDVNPFYNSLFKLSIQPFLISWFQYDPCKEISKLRIPSLIVGGTRDENVESEDAKLLAKADTNSVLKIIKNMNHWLKFVPTEEEVENIKLNGDVGLPLSEKFSEVLTEYLKAP